MVVPFCLCIFLLRRAIPDRKDAEMFMGQSTTVGRTGLKHAVSVQTGSREQILMPSSLCIQSWTPALGMMLTTSTNMRRNFRDKLRGPSPRWD